MNKKNLLPKFNTTHPVTIQTLNELVDMINNNTNTINEPTEILTTELPEVGDPKITYYVPLPEDEQTEYNKFAEYKYINDNWELIGYMNELPAPAITQPVTFTLDGEEITYDGTATMAITLNESTVTYDGTQAVNLDIDSYVKKKVKEHADLLVNPNNGTNGAHGIRINDEGTVQYYDDINDVWEDAAGGTGFANRLLPPTEFSVTRTDDDQVQIKFSDSGDRMSGSDIVVAWNYSVVVRKVGSAPRDMNDGVVIINNSVLNQYKSTPFIDDTAQLGNDYYYGLFCIDENDVAVAYKQNPIQLDYKEILATNPTDAVMNNGDTTFNVTFTTTDPRTASYKLVYNTNNYPTSITDGIVVNDYTSGTPINNLTNGTKYYCTLYALNKYGTPNDGLQLLAEPVNTPADPVTNIVATPGYQQVQLSFTIGDNTESVRLVYGTEPITSHLQSANTTVVEPFNSGDIVTGLTNGTTYYFRLYPKNIHGEYNSSGGQEVSSTPEDVIPSLVTVGLKASDSKITVSWTGDDTVGSVRVVYKAETESGVENYPTSPTDGTYTESSNSTIEITGLTNDTKYYFSIFSINPYGTLRSDEYVKINGVPSNPKVYGVKFNGTDPVGERLESAIGLNSAVALGLDATVTNNDFDNIYPWRDICEVYLDENGNESEEVTDWRMVRIPKFAVKKDFSHEESDGTLSDYWYITDKLVDGFRWADPFIDKQTGEIKDYIYVGKYNATVSGTKLVSKSGVTPTGSYTREQFRTYAKAIGDGSKYHLLDVSTWMDVIQPLFVIEHANRDSQAVYNMTGNAKYSSVTNTGNCDNALYHSCKEYNDNTFSHSTYRYMEDLWFNIRLFLDGYYGDNTKVWVCNDPSKYGETTEGYTYVYIKSGNFGYYSNLSIPNDSTPWFHKSNGIYNASDTTGYTDYETDYANNVIYVGGYLSTRGGGLFSSNASVNSSYTDNEHGARLAL